jgi:RNA polymerase sigma factor (sigma-70 family)
MTMIIPGGSSEEDSDSALTPCEEREERAEWSDWAQLVDRIREGESQALEKLYRTFSKGIRFHLCRQFGADDLDDKVHDIFLIVVQAIRRGDLREPERLMGFVRTVVRRQVAAQIDKAVHTRRDRVDLESTMRISDGRQNPEEVMLFNQKLELMNQALDGLSKRDREILTRFYLLEESQEQICADMGLSETQFRLLKSRAKLRFGELGKKKLVQKSLSFLVRAVAGS